MIQSYFASKYLRSILLDEVLFCQPDIQKLPFFVINIYGKRLDLEGNAVIGANEVKLMRKCEFCEGFDQSLALGIWPGIT